MMYQLIGAASGWGAQIRACEKGPEILNSFGLLEKLVEKGFPMNAWKMLFSDKRAAEEEIPLELCLPLIHAFNRMLAHEVEKTLEAKEFPIILGGDHSIAVGTWNGVHQFCKKTRKLPLGLIWIDAHMDAHTAKTTPSGAWHGMPLAALLGYGDPQMAHLLGKEPVIFAEHLCLIGVRSYESEEAELLRSLNVRIFFMKEVLEKGMENVMREALAHVKRGVKYFGVSLDLDAIEPQQAPGVGSPEEGGIEREELMRGLELLQKEPTLVAFEMVEYNPQRNHYEMTARLCYDILSKIMHKRDG